MGILFFLLFLATIGVGVWRGFTVTEDKRGYGHNYAFSAFKGIPFYVGSLAFLFLALSYTSIDAGQVGVVKRFGNPVRELDPGAHFVLPVADAVTGVVTQTRIVKPSEDAASKDLQIVTFEVTLAFHVDSKYASYVLVNLNNDEVDRIINPAVLEAIKSVTAQYDVQDLISKRPEVRDKIEEFVKARIAPYHIIAESTSITNFAFSKQYEASIEAKVTAQQLAEKATNDLRRIEIEANQKVAAAEGEAKALAAQKAQITPELLQLRTIEMMKEKWDGQLPNVIVGGQSALPMMDVLAAARQAQKK